MYSFCKLLEEAKKWRLYQYQQKVLEENILKLFYEVLQTERCGYDTPQPLSRLLQQRALSSSQLLHGLSKLAKKRLVTKKGSHLFQLTLAGKEKGEKILRLHELWEAYLRTHLHIFVCNFLVSFLIIHITFIV